MSLLTERLAARLTLSPPPPPGSGRRSAAVAVVLDADRVLMMQRAVRVGDPWSGHISLPGGGFHPEDGDLVTTAIRETQEELGIDLNGTRLLGNLAPLHPHSSGPDGVEVTPFVFAIEAAVEPVCGPEAVAAFWLPIELAAGGSLDGTYAHPGSALTFPSWTWQGHVIWGLTLRIIADLMTFARPGA